MTRRNYFYFGLEASHGEREPGDARVFTLPHQGDSCVLRLERCESPDIQSILDRSLLDGACVVCMNLNDWKWTFFHEVNFIVAIRYVNIDLISDFVIMTGSMAVSTK